MKYDVKKEPPGGIQAAAGGRETKCISDREIIPYPAQNHNNGQLISQPNPYSAEAEEAVIGTLLIAPDEILQAEFLAADDFYLPDYRHIFQVVRDFYLKGLRIDNVVICEELRRRSQNTSLVFLGDLEDAAPSTAHIVEYAKIVFDHSITRRLIYASTEIAQLAHRPDGITPAEMVAEAAGLIGAIDAGRGEDRDPWQIFSLEDAYELRPPVLYAVSGIISRPSLNIVFSPPGQLKSLFLQDMSICVAAGLPWLPAYPGTAGHPIAVKQCPVFWVDLDNGSRIMHERVEAVARGRDLKPGSTPFHYVSMPDPWPIASDPASMDMLTERVARLGAGLVVIDNLSTVLGDIEENSGQMAQVMSRFRRLAEETNAGLVLVHHQRKTTGIKNRAGDSLRGHSSIEAALDLALRIQRESGSGIVSIQSTKTRGVDVPKIQAQFTYSHKPGTTELEAAKFYRLKSDDDDATDNGVMKIIKDVVRDNPDVTQGKLVKDVREALPDIGINRIRALANLMADRGELSCIVAKSGAKNYSLGRYTPPVKL